LLEIFTALFGLFERHENNVNLGKNNHILFAYIESLDTNALSEKVEGEVVHSQFAD
jgi:hypothetical protein